MEVDAVRGVLGSTLALLEEGATHVGVATDHVIESFRNDMWPGYKTSAGIEPELLAQFPLLEDALRALGVTVWAMVDLEADDALAAAARTAADDPRGAQGRRRRRSATGTRRPCCSVTSPRCAPTRRWGPWTTGDGAARVRSSSNSRIVSARPSCWRGRGKPPRGGSRDHRPARAHPGRHHAPDPRSTRAAERDEPRARRRSARGPRRRRQRPRMQGRDPHRRGAGLLRRP